MGGVAIDLEGRAIVVGGAGGGGIGTVTAALLAKAGATIIGVDKTEIGRTSAEEALAASGGRYRVLDADLTDPEALEKSLIQAAGDFGPIRGAVNVVGGMLPHHWGPLMDPNAAEAFDDAMRFNLKPAFVTSTTVARMVAAHGQGGSIVHIASVVGLISMAYGAGYAAAKAALVNLTRTMAVEWGRHGLRVNAVAPGTIRTKKLGRTRFDTGETEEMLKRTRGVVPLGRRGEPDDIAGAVLFLLSDLAGYITGQTIAVDGGAVARAPFTDGDDLPVFVSDPATRARMLGQAGE